MTPVWDEQGEETLTSLCYDELVWGLKQTFYTDFWCLDQSRYDLCFETLKINPEYDQQTLLI